MTQQIRYAIPVIHRPGLVFGKQQNVRIRAGEGGMETTTLLAGEISFTQTTFFVIQRGFRQSA